MSDKQKDIEAQMNEDTKVKVKVNEDNAFENILSDTEVDIDDAIDFEDEQKTENIGTDNAFDAVDNAFDTIEKTIQDTKKHNDNIEIISSATEKDKKLQEKELNGENVFIISGIDEDNSLNFISEIGLLNKTVTWTSHTLEAKIFREVDLEENLYLLRDLYMSTQEYRNIEIKKFYWSKYNTLTNYFENIENKLNNIKSKMTEEEYRFLLKYNSTCK